MTTSADEFVDLVVARIKAGCQAMFVATGGQLGLALELLHRAAVKAKYRVVCEWDGLSGCELIQYVKGQPNKSYKVANTNSATVLLNELASGNLLNSSGKDQNQLELDEENETRPLSEVEKEKTGAGSKSVRALVIAHDLFSYFSPGQQGAVTLPSVLKRHIARSHFNNDEHELPLVILATHDNIPPAIRPYVVAIDLPYPEFPQIDAAVKSVLDSGGSKLAGTPDSARNEMSRLCLGLTVPETVETVSTACVISKSFNDRTLEIVEKEKAKIIRGIPGLSHVSRKDVQAAEIGGYEVLRGWLEEQKAAYSGKAADKLDNPKGIMLVGSPGTGKSAAGRLVAKVFGSILFQFDISSVMAGIVGESERNLQLALDAVSANQDCVLLMDEVDKGLGGSHRQSGDSGTTKRMLGKVLTWMNDKKSRIFVVMTANRTDDLPPELMRPGRLDDVWFVDLPNKAERRAIFDIHTAKRGLTLMGPSFDSVIEATKDYSGAEIERVVVAAMRAKAAKNPDWLGHDLTVSELASAAASIRPISAIDADGVAAIREFGKKLKAASLSEEESENKIRRSNRKLNLEPSNN